MADSSSLLRQGYILLFCLLFTHAAETAETVEAAEARPDLALLEFLGSFAQADEAWLDTALDEEQKEQSGSKSSETVEDTHNE